MSKIYVGHYFNCMEVPPFISTDHPNDFEKLGHDAFTNHPYLVDLYKGDEVVVVSKKGGRKLLSEHPNYEKWKNKMMSGEFWSVVGETWVDAEARS